MAHMIEHLVIGDVASLFLVLGMTRSILQPVLAIKFFNRLQFLANPFVAFPLWAINLFFWHIPVMYDAAYVGAEEVEDSDEDFATKMQLLTEKLGEQMSKGAELDQLIRQKLGGLGYEF